MHPEEPEWAASTSDRTVSRESWSLPSLDPFLLELSVTTVDEDAAEERRRLGPGLTGGGSVRESEGEREGGGKRESEILSGEERRQETRTQRPGTHSVSPLSSSSFPSFSEAASSSSTSTTDVTSSSS